MPVISNRRVLERGYDSVTAAQAFGYIKSGNGGALNDGEIRQIVSAVWTMAALCGSEPGPTIAQMVHETAFFTFPGQVDISQKNPAGIGATNDGSPGLSYATWTIGIRGYYVHLAAWLGGPEVLPAIEPWYTTQIDPRIHIVEGVRATKGPVVVWGDLAGRWAVPGIGYAAALDRHYSGLLATPEGGRMVHLALSSGHHNTDGGDALEFKQTGELCEAVARHAKALGIEVTVIQPDGPDPDADPGDGTLNIGLQAVARKVVELDKTKRVDYYLETHTEGGGGTGVFCIYPDAPARQDVDTDVRDVLGPAISKAVSLATGLGLGAGGDGVMSEQQTGVGGTGSRLGIFFATEPLKDHCTRWITEYGAHDKQPDLAIQGRAGFYDLCGRATAQQIALHAGLPVDPVPPPDVEDEISKALTGWYASLPLNAQGDLSNSTFYECDVDFSFLYPSIQGWQRAIRGEFLMAWFYPDGKILCVHPQDKIAIETTEGKLRRR